MSKVLFISDFFVSHLNGGAENNDSVLIEHLSKTNEVSVAQSHKVTSQSLDKYDFIVVSNFTYLSEAVKAKLEKEKEYIIYEHDHKYVSGRDPSKYPDFLVPEDDLINVSFYEKSKCVIVLSKICKSILEKNIPSCNVHSIGCSLWSENAFEMIEQLSDSEKKYEYCVVNSKNPIKSTAQTLELCNKKGINPFLLESSGHKEFLISMSKCEKLVFLPAVLETFSRLCAEAKMLGLSVMTTPKKVGFLSEDIYSLSGKELIEQLRQRNKLALSYFDSLVDA